MLVWIGQRRLHLHDFVQFLVIILGLAAAIAVIFVATARRENG